MRLATKLEFEISPVGTPFMEACRICKLETGNILMKTSGKQYNRDIKDSWIPRYICKEDSICEYCAFLNTFMNSQSVTNSDGEEVEEEQPEPGNWAAAKIMKEGDDGLRELLAYVPFGDSEPAHISLAEGDVTLKHGMVILAIAEGESYSLQKVVEKGKEFFVEYSKV